MATLSSELSDLETALISSPESLVQVLNHGSNETRPVLLTQKGLENKKRNEEAQLKLHLKEIAEAVKMVFHFGSPNNIRNTNSELESAFNELFFEVRTAYSCMVDLASDSIQDSTQKRHMRSMLLQQEDFFGIPFEEVEKYFAYNPANGAMLLNPAVIPKLLKYKQELIKQLSTKERNIILQQMTTLAKDKKSLLMMLASMSCDWVRNVKDKDKITGAIQAKGTSETSQEELKKIILLGAHYCLNTKKEPSEPLHRQAVMQYIVRDVLFSGYINGTGNCQLLAESAFLLAIQRLNNLPISYIQFSDDKGHREALNGIIVGPWPAPGCVVLAPWRSSENITWNGEFSKTPDLAGYNRASVFFTIKDEAEREFWAKEIEKYGFNHEAQLKNKNRLNMIGFIERLAEKILAAISSCVVKPKHRDRAHP